MFLCPLPATGSSTDGNRHIPIGRPVPSSIVCLFWFSEYVIDKATIQCFRVVLLCTLTAHMDVMNLSLHWLVSEYVQNISTNTSKQIITIAKVHFMI